MIDNVQGRRFNTMQMVQAERELLAAAMEIEKMGDDVKLHKAQTFVAKAMELVADYVDGINRTK